MKNLILGFVILAATILVAAASVVSKVDPDGLTVHEWGTFTSVADEAGNALMWLPWGGSSDLPCFVNRYQNSNPKLSYAATVRMETPVIYFYSPRELTAQVGVQFRHGLITEWFPQAAVSPGAYMDGQMKEPTFAGSIEWSAVKVAPKAAEVFPRDDAASHYYAARQTDSIGVESSGQKEKFLFYRGIGDFQPPVKATLNNDGQVVVRNSGADEIGNVILFENRDGKMGYRMGRPLRDSVALDKPALNADFASLRADLVEALVAGGLYPKEAAAMVQTWSDSWFEEGSRIFYILPQQAVDGILPLTIKPKPNHISRVFVGRMELITPTTLAEIEGALANSDRATLQKYGRFLEPLSSRVIAKLSQGDRQRANNLVSGVASAYRSQASAVCR